MNRLALLALLALSTGCLNAELDARLASMENKLTQITQTTQTGQNNRQITNDAWTNRLAVLSGPVCLGVGLGCYWWLKRTRLGNRILYGKKSCNLLPNHGYPEHVVPHDEQTTKNISTAYQTVPPKARSS